MLATFTQLGTALTKNAEVAFSKGTKLAPKAGRMIFNVQMTKDKITESDTYSFDQVSRNTGEGGVYASSDPVKGYNLILTQAKFTQSFEHTKEIGMYDKYSVVNVLKGIQGLGTSGANRFELDLQLLVGQGTGSSYEDLDGNTISTQSADSINLFVTATHTVRSGGTFGNLDATAFGQTGLEADELLQRNFINHDGEQTDRISTDIYTTRTPSLVNLVDEYRNARGHVEDEAHGLNVYNTNFSRAQGTRYGHIIMEYLDATNLRAVDTDKADYWGTVNRGAESLQAKVSQNPIVYAPQLVQRTRNVLIQTDLHYDYGVRDAFDITQHNS